MTGRLQDKVAVITGAGKGIGRASALALAREGAHVVITSRTKADLDALAAEVEALNTGARALVIPADVSSEQDVERLAQATYSEFQHVDILVNNAGVGKNGTVASLTTADYDWIMNTNMRSTWLCTKAFMPAMLERKTGNIIFVSSVAGLSGLPNEPIYCATKFAQIGFAQSIDYECYPNNVKVSVIAPGGTNTQYGFYNGSRTPGDPMLDSFQEAEDVADGVVFAATQPPKSRVFMIWMRPMNESLGAGSGANFKAASVE
ncbi:MAG: SDR family oxidoreductase [Chitinophagaceae bacterium]|nr:SDR family oxidoreductase [Anaerolineae bacterium]